MQTMSKLSSPTKNVEADGANKSIGDKTEELSSCSRQMLMCVCITWGLVYMKIPIQESAMQAKILHFPHIPEEQKLMLLVMAEHLNIKVLCP